MAVRTGVKPEFSHATGECDNRYTNEPLVHICYYNTVVRIVNTNIIHNAKSKF